MAMNDYTHNMPEKVKDERMGSFTHCYCVHCAGSLFQEQHCMQPDMTTEVGASKMSLMNYICQIVSRDLIHYYSEFCRSFVTASAVRYALKNIYH